MAADASPSLVLASGSPRRRELLQQIGVHFEVVPVELDERVQRGEKAAAYVERLALEKAQAGLALRPRAVVLGSDTAVVCDDRILGKPADREEGVAMLRQLSGRSHRVLTAVALVSRDACLSRVVATLVHFRSLERAECERYWETGEPWDKAGGYGIQGLGSIFVDRIEGSYSSVVGLPLAETAQLLERMGIPVWQLDERRQLHG